MKSFVTGEPSYRTVRSVWEVPRPNVREISTPFLFYFYLLFWAGVRHGLAQGALFLSFWAFSHCGCCLGRGARRFPYFDPIYVPPLLFPHTINLPMGNLTRTSSPHGGMRSLFVEMQWFEDDQYNGSSPHECNCMSPSTHNCMSACRLQLQVGQHIGTRKGGGWQLLVHPRVAIA